MGQVFINLLGLNQSRYQWAIDEAKREKERIYEVNEIIIFILHSTRLVCENVYIYTKIVSFSLFNIIHNA